MWSRIKSWWNQKTLEWTLNSINFEALSNLDVNEIRLRNVMELISVSEKSAYRICELAVRKGLFERRPRGAKGYNEIIYKLNEQVR